MREQEPIPEHPDHTAQEKPGARAARYERRVQRKHVKPTQANEANLSSDDALAASEPMELQRLPEDATRVRPGRQRTGDPPAR